MVVHLNLDGLKENSYCSSELRLIDVHSSSVINTSLTIKRLVYYSLFTYVHLNYSWLIDITFVQLVLLVLNIVYNFKYR